MVPVLFLLCVKNRYKKRKKEKKQCSFFFVRSRLRLGENRSSTKCVFF